MRGHQRNLADFFAEVVSTGYAFTLIDDGAIRVATTSKGKRAIPYWSSLERIEAIIATVPDLSGCKPARIKLDELMRAWLPGMERDGHLVGVNWVGARPAGYDLEPRKMLEHLERALE